MRERASPFLSRPTPGSRGGAASSAVTISELRPDAFCELLDMPGADAGDRERALAALLPGAAALRVGETASARGLTIGRLAPRRIIMIGARPTPDVLAGLDGAFAVVDDSHARSGLRIAATTPTVLADGLGNGISLDLSVEAFPVGRIAQVRGFGLGLTLVRRTPTSCDLFTVASFADSLFDAVTDALLEQGWQIGPPTV